jgi:hypothetical protein
MEDISDTGNWIDRNSRNYKRFVRQNLVLVEHEMEEAGATVEAE